MTSFDMKKVRRHGGAKHLADMDKAIMLAGTRTLCVIKRDKNYDVYDNDSEERNAGRPKEMSLNGLLRLNGKMYARTKQNTGQSGWWEKHAERGAFGIFRD